MEAEVSLPCSKEHTIELYHEPDNIIHPLIYSFFKIHFNSILLSTPRYANVYISYTLNLRSSLSVKRTSFTHM